MKVRTTPGARVPRRHARLLLVVTAAIAFASGWAWRGWLTTRPPETGPAAASAISSRATAVSERRLPPETPAPPRAAPDVAARLQSAHRAPTRAARLLAFASALVGASDTDYPALLQALYGTNTPERPEMLAMLCAAWARRAGPEAFAAARELATRDGQHSAFHAAIAAWASHDPAAAQAALVSAGVANLARDEMTAFLRGWASHDAAAAEAYLRSIPVGADGMDAGLPVAAQCGYEVVARARVQASPEDALAWYQGLSAGLRERLRPAMAAEFAAASPALAHRWLAEDATAQLGIADLLPLLRTAHIEGLDGQFAWAQSMANAVTRESAIDAVVREAAATDLVRLGEWLAARSDDATLTHAFSRYAAEVARKSPPSAVTWALSLDEPALRRRTLETVALEWAAHDSPAARRWANESRLVDWESLMR